MEMDRTREEQNNSVELTMLLSTSLSSNACQKSEKVVALDVVTPCCQATDQRPEKPLGYTEPQENMKERACFKDSRRGRKKQTHAPLS